MKLKLSMFAVMGLLLSRQPAMTQTNLDTNAVPTDSMTATATAVISASQTNPITPINPPGAVPIASNAIVVAVETVPAGPTNAAVAVPVVAAVAVAVPVANTASVPPTNAVAPAGSTSASTQTATIPLIEFQDVPLTVAIENLARQAGINYLLDPKIAYGQPDQNGQIKAEPTLSIRWENVTAEQALLALLNNYELQLVQDPQTKIARITVKDPTAPPPLFTRVVQLKFASTSNMMESVEAAFTDRRSHVLPDTRTSQLIVVATEGEQDAVDTLVAELDKPTRQVLIEAKLMQISSTPETSKGVNWSGTVAGQNVSFGNGVLQPGPTSQSIKSIGSGLVSGSAPSGGITTTPTGSGSSTTLTTFPQPSTAPGGLAWNTLTGLTPAIGFLNADGVQAVLSFLNLSYDAQTLSTPRLVTLDNEPATISVTRQYPVINITASTAGVSSGSTSITYSNIGTTLIVTPRITANDYIWLKVIPDVSSFFGTISKVIAGSEYQADVFDSRHIETQVMIPNGNTLVMGGLIEDNPTASYTAVPVLGNIPYLGWAFKSESVSMDKENLIIFITPTIVKDSDFQPASTDFLASRPAPMKEPMNPNSFWDKPEPGDWSNPAPMPGEFDRTPAAAAQ